MIAILKIYYLLVIFKISAAFILIIVGSILIRETIGYINSTYLRENNNLTKGNDTRKLEHLNGLIEQTMYVSAFLISKPEFIVFWTGIKTALLWFRQVKPIYHKQGLFDTFVLTTGSIKTNVDLEATALRQNFENKVGYLRFLIGNALNIVASFVISYYLDGGNPL